MEIPFIKLDELNLEKLEDTENLNVFLKYDPFMLIKRASIITLRFTGVVLTAEIFNKLIETMNSKGYELNTIDLGNNRINFTRK
jgi:hypothetical protein